MLKASGGGLRVRDFATQFFGRWPRGWPIVLVVTLSFAKVGSPCPKDHGHMVAASGRVAFDIALQNMLQNPATASVASPSDFARQMAERVVARKIKPDPSIKCSMVTLCQNVPDMSVLPLFQNKPFFCHEASQTLHGN